MNISAKFFWFIFILILLLPFSIHWKLFLYGAKTEGKVVNYKTISSYRNHGYYAVIEFSTDYEKIRFLGPDNYTYPLGKKITIFYNKENPDDFIPMNIAALYLDKYFLFPGVLLFLWIAFYVSLRQTQNQKRKKAENRRFHF